LNLEDTATGGKRRFRFGLRWKIVFLVFVAASAVIAAQALVYAHESRGSLERLVERRAMTLAEIFAHDLSPDWQVKPTAEILAELQAAMEAFPDMALVGLRDERGQPLGEVRHPAIVGAALGWREAGAEPAWLETGAHRVVLAAVPVADRGAVTEGTKARLGTVQVALLYDDAAQETSRIAWRTAEVAILVLLGVLVLAFVGATYMSSRLERLAAAASSMARGDLALAPIDDRGNDEVAELSRAFAGLGTSLREMVADLHSASGEIEREAKKVLSTATLQATRANQHAAALGETNATVREIAQTSALAAEHADGVIEVTRKAEELSGDGTRAVEENVQGIEKLAGQVRAIAGTITDLSERTLQISDIIATVREVADQSNLLALNASIEAAKAGEHGRGFAVVAMEMRNLAEQSKVAANEVRSILGEIQKGTRDAVVATEEGSRSARETAALAAETGRTIAGLAEAIRESAAAAREIAENTRQQTVGVEQIVQAVAELSTAMEDTVAGTRDIERVASTLTTLSGRLGGIVGRYRA
jgi:methyl-accepting chemotaxis protein